MANSHDRKDIGPEHPLNHLGQIGGAVLFLAVWILDSFVLRYTTIIDVPLFVSVPGAVLVLVLAIYLIRTGLNIVFAALRDPPEVIRKGVFSAVRHPVYLGSMLILVSLFLSTFSLASLGVILVNFAFYNSMATYEEKILISIFDDRYRDYQRKVGRWFPKPQRTQP